MAIKFLKKASELGPEEVSAKYLLHKHFNGANPGRSKARIHASELTKSGGFCPREYALWTATGAEVEDEWLSTSEEVTFQMGRRLQEDITHAFADMGKAITDWRCLGCGALHPWQGRPTKCKCGCKGFMPEEPRFISGVSGASCGVDLFIKTKKPLLTPVEIKTMDKDQFKALVAPLGEHKHRTNLYLRIMAEAEDDPRIKQIDLTDALVLYASKGGYGVADPTLTKWGLTEKFSPFKEWHVKRDDKATNEETRRSRAVFQYREGEVGMPCGICTTAFAPRANKCPMRKPCFSGEYPAEHDWTKDGA